MARIVFGYETLSNMVLCMITHNDIFDNLIEYIAKRGTPTILSHEQCELQDFFTGNTSIDATWRILYKMNGTTVMKRSGIPGEFVYLQTTG
jgi:hypothetical protein